MHFAGQGFENSKKKNQRLFVAKKKAEKLRNRCQRLPVVILKHRTKKEKKKKKKSTDTIKTRQTNDCSWSLLNTEPKKKRSRYQKKMSRYKKKIMNRDKKKNEQIPATARGGAWQQGGGQDRHVT